MEQQLEVRNNPALVDWLRDQGHESSGWYSRGEDTATFFPNSRQLRSDIRRFRNSVASEPIGTLRELFEALRASVMEPAPERPDLPVVNK